MCHSTYYLITFRFLKFYLYLSYPHLVHMLNTINLLNDYKSSKKKNF
ncbi:hypothetical protein CoNPh26_CDS0074 [Staphylococcus phage S-CoN_Ph26]|nr:hypothetical protein CoNPh26_CDS0074 [Staphylococcus phage S-CoN_Ph26]